MSAPWLHLSRWRAVRQRDEWLVRSERGEPSRTFASHREAQDHADELNRAEQHRIAGM